MRSQSSLIGSAQFAYFQDTSSVFIKLAVPFELEISSEASSVLLMKA